jgi:hypothetical protein
MHVPANEIPVPLVHESTRPGKETYTRIGLYVNYVSRTDNNAPTPPLGGPVTTELPAGPTLPNLNEVKEGLCPVDTGMHGRARN